MSPRERATAVLQGLREREQTRGTQRLVIEEGPDPVTNPKGEQVGVEMMVRLYDGKDEVQIDPHRVFVNPPTRMDKDSETDPNGALWHILWDSVITSPNRRQWVRAR